MLFPPQTKEGGAPKWVFMSVLVEKEKTAYCLIIALSQIPTHQDFKIM